MDKVKEILAAALKLFVEYGFHGTPTSKIAQEAGVANGTLFHYFKTKEDLIIALYIDTKTRLAQHLIENVLPETTIKAKLKNRYLQVMFWAVEHSTEFRFIQQFHTSPFLSRLSAEEMYRQMKPDLDLIEEGIAAKIIQPRPTDFIFSLFFNHIYGLHQYLVNAKLSTVDQKILIEDTFEMLWGMIT
ncbi:TetR/AcrR family transcriptional regulator [Haliscomenobacter sp.]|uniref:TetR/AcrR family transcriptional regulator n=1 Tax=Haliscomenobacter sp. TaxID=2717303 RepID=UPI003593D91B